ncbi:MAG: signal recognition particle-docking protein FtsY [Magnetococcales bacterium]|nr:signal recognition particle-docking protein FtsY [Magnetococcales bacterium]MBF0155714.1 signal recognition particle-docking protein FtsY [Magnetococcales bacterium]
MSFFKRLKEGLSKTRQGFTERLGGLIRGRAIDEGLLAELEDLMITSDFGVATAQALLKEATGRVKRQPQADADTLRQALREVVTERLQGGEALTWESVERPHVILVVGVNGVGKTTTIGKLANLLRTKGKSVILAAGDTFRAAAVEQLGIWGKRAGSSVISQGEGADSASVIYDALASARAKGVDFLIADTAGRLHTKSNLMEELKKIRRVLGRLDPLAPHDVWLVLDATTGQNALSQVRQFHQDLQLTGLIVTKLDGTAKGGVVVGIHETFGIPIRFLGMGEGLDDLRPFEAKAFAEALFDL